MNHQYKILCPWGNKEKKEQFLLQETETKYLYIKKYVPLEKQELYMRLVGKRHQYLVYIKDIIIESDRLAILEEFINQPTLEQYFEDRHPFPPDQILSWMLELCEGTAALHKMGIIHRDLKPENIFISSDRHVKIGDFNISRIYQTRKNNDTQILGTQGFAAPEQYGYGQSDEKSDIYSLGVIFNYLFTGKTIQEELYCEDKATNQIIIKATAIDARKRYQHIRQMKKAIKTRINLLKKVTK